jgi:hypothetical protein
VNIASLHNGVRLDGCTCKKAHQQRTAIVCEPAETFQPSGQEPIVQKFGNIDVVRDDLLPGGSKSRFLSRLMELPYKQFVYASPTYGGAQIALAKACASAEKTAIIISPDREELHARTDDARREGALVFQQPGTMEELDAVAANYAEINNAYHVPLGCHSPLATQAITDAASQVKAEFGVYDEVWCVAGSGTVIKALQQSGLGKEYHAVAVGDLPELQGVHVVKSPLDVEAEATDKPPFPSCPTYDAKAWAFVKDRPGKVLFWNVM